MQPAIILDLQKEFLTEASSAPKLFRDLGTFVLYMKASILSDAEIKDDCRNDPKAGRSILVIIAKQKTPQKDGSTVYQIQGKWSHAR